MINTNLHPISLTKLPAPKLLQIIGHIFAFDGGTSL